MVRRLSRGLPFIRGQLVFDFYKSEVGRLAKKSDELQRRKRRKQLRKRLLQWMDTEVRDIPAEVLVQLDELMRQRIKEVQAKWTPEDEADRRGLDVRKLGKLTKHDGRYFDPCSSIPSGSSEPSLFDEGMDG